MRSEKKGKVPTDNLQVYAKVHRLGRSVLLSICDAELLGKILREGRIVFEVSEAFYKGLKMSVKNAIDLVGKSTIVNMVGHHTIREALDRGLIHPEAILTISGIPHGQIVKM